MLELSNNPDAGEIKETSLWSGLLFLAAAWRCLSETDCLCTRRALIGLLWDCSGDEGQRVPFDWGLFYSQAPAVAPTVSNNHWCTSHPLSLVVFIQYFKWIALQKSTQAQAITCGHKERCSWKLLHWLRQKKNTHMPLPASGAFIKPLISLLTFSLRRLTLPTLMPRVVPAWNWPCLTPEAGSGPWWQEEVPQWCTGKIPKDQTP